MKRLFVLLAALFLACIAGAGSASAIVGGADTNARPWMGSMQMKSDGSHGCGASAISPTWAVTAFHCVDGWINDPSLVQFRFGSADRTTGGTLVNAKRAVVPDGANLFGKDVALVELASPVPGPYAKLSEATPANNSRVEMIGWGVTCPQSLPGIFYCGQPPLKLQSATVNLSADWMCTSLPQGISGPNELCVGSYFEGKSACFGDSGGPAIVGDRVVGVTSRTTHVWLYGNCQIAPAIYTDLAVHRGWIKTITGV